MNKTKFFSSMLVVALFATASVVTSCKDYDDDIKGLQTQIDDLNKTLGQIQTLITSGSVITDVKSLTDGTGGVEIFLSNNSSYKIYNGAKGADGAKGDKGDTGATGAAGADGAAPVVTIGDNGNWFVNGVDTGKPSQGAAGAKGDKGDTGEKGEKGEKGDKGEAGAAGSLAVYYVPGTEGAEKGFWVKVDPNANPATRTVTTDKWVGVDPDMVSAVYDTESGLLTLVNVKGASETDEYGNVVLSLNNALRALVFAGDIIEEGEINRAYVDGVPAIRLTSYTYTPLENQVVNGNATKNTRNEHWINIQEKNADNVMVDKKVLVNPTTIAYYHVNPANAKIDENLALSYVVKANGDFQRTRANATDDFDVQVADWKYDSKTGILAVTVQTSGKPATGEKISTAALQVVKENDEIVTSDYATLYDNAIKNLVIGNEPKLVKNKKDYHFRRGYYYRTIGTADGAATIDNAAAWDETLNPTAANLDAAKAACDTTLCVKPGSSLDLNALVAAHKTTSENRTSIRCANGDEPSFANEEALGLSWKFELVENYKLGTNQTDQKEFVNLTNGVLTPKVYDADAADGFSAAIGRTPIVRVSLMRGEDVIKVAYIKVLMVAEEAAPKEDIVIDLGSTSFACDGQKLTVDTKKMNTLIYNKLGYSKEGFHTHFNQFFDNTYKDDVPAGNLKKDELGTQTYNITWTISKDNLWKNGGKEIQNKVVFYTVGTGTGSTDVVAAKPANATDSLVVVLKAKVNTIQKDFSVAAADYISNFWNTEKTQAQMNVNVPDSKTANAPTGADKRIVKNLNTLFKNRVKTGENNGEALVDLNKDITLVKYYFKEFTGNDLKTKEVVGNSGNKYILKVYDNELRQVYVGGTPKAVTNANVRKIAVINNYGEITFNSDDATVQDLLNTDAFTVDIQGKPAYCAETTRLGNEISFNGQNFFTVKFIRPVNIAENSSNGFIHNKDNDTNVVKLVDLFKFTDWRGVAIKYATEYWSYYGISYIDVDVTKAAFFIDGDNTNGGKGWSTANVGIQLVQNGNTPNSGTLQYLNGNVVVENEYKIKVPVKITYTWGEINYDNVVLTVKPRI